MRELKWFGIAFLIFALALLITASVSRAENRVMARIGTCDQPDQVEALYRSFLETEDKTIGDALTEVNGTAKPACGFGDLIFIPAAAPIKTFILGDMEYGIFPMFVLAYNNGLGFVSLQKPLPQFGVRAMGKAQSA